MVWIAVTAALVSAAFLALGTQRQAAAVRNAHGREVSGKQIVEMLKNRTWLFGLVLMITGVILNIVALSLAPLTVVQPLGAVALVLTTIINSWDRKIRINGATWRAIAVCTIGAIGFVLLAIKATHETFVTGNQRVMIIILLGISGIILGVLALVHRRRKGGAIFYIVGAGILFGFTAVLVRTIAVTFLNWDPEAIWWEQVPWGAMVAIVIVGIMGQYFNQHAYASGPPELVVAGLTVIDPMVGVLIGVIILGELAPGLAWYTACGMIAAGVIAIIGVLQLSRHHPDSVAPERTEVR